MPERIKRLLPIGYLNYYRYFKHRAAQFPIAAEGLTGVFDAIYRNNYWQGTDSICGRTSGPEETKIMRAALQALWRDLGIRSVLDIPCGDFAWMKEMDLTGIDYSGADIVPAMIEQNNRRHGADKIRFVSMDLTSDHLPAVDLIICRDCLLHLSFDHIHKAMARIKASGSTWLLCTTFTQNKFNYDIRDGLWRTLNMQLRPFWFPPPAHTITDNQSLEQGVFRDKALGLWKISTL